MNTRALNELADLICRAQENGKRTPMGIAFAIDAAGRHMSPEVAAELERLRGELAVSEQRSERRRIAWRMARTRALSTGGAADRYAARAREMQTALQDMLAALLTAQIERDAARARITELETERHSTNEALDDAARALRADRDRIAELEQAQGLADRERVELLAGFERALEPFCAEPGAAAAAVAAVRDPDREWLLRDAQRLQARVIELEAELGGAL